MSAPECEKSLLAEGYVCYVTDCWNRRESAMISWVLVAVFAPAVAIAASPFDGTYTGTRTLTSGFCRPSTKATAAIKDGVVSVPAGGALFEMQVASDEHFSGHTTIKLSAWHNLNVGLTFQGQALKNRLEFDSVSSGCTVHFSLVKND